MREKQEIFNISNAWNRYMLYHNCAI
jgi:hypothetical protein